MHFDTCNMETLMVYSEPRKMIRRVSQETQLVKL